MDIKDFKAGRMIDGAGYKYFLPEKSTIRMSGQMKLLINFWKKRR